MNYHVNEYIKNTVRVFPMQNRYGMHRYDMNENPEGLPKEFVDSVLKEITPEFLAIYPEPDRFLHKYAKFSVRQNRRMDDFTQWGCFVWLAAAKPCDYRWVVL